MKKETKRKFFNKSIEIAEKTRMMTGEIMCLIMVFDLMTTQSLLHAFIIVCALHWSYVSGIINGKECDYERYK